MAAGVNVPLTFAIYKGDQLIRTETLTQDIIKVGKLSSSHLRLDDENVARMHAVVEVTGASDIYIIDLGSTKGTFVNGQKVNKCKLQTNDEIVLGDTRIVVTVGQPVAAGTVSTPMAPAADSSRQTVMGMNVVSPGIPAPMAAAGGVPSPFGQPAAAAAPAPMAPMAYGPPADTSAIELKDGSRAVEVMALFEDAIVEARHFSNPATGSVKGSTKAMLGGGGAALVGAVVLFIVTYVQIAHLKAVREAAEKAGSTESFAPISQGSPVVDIVMALLVLGGLAAVVWGLFRRAEELQARDFTIGPDPKSIFNAPGELLPVPLFPLVHSTGTSYQLLYTARMQGDVTVGGTTTSLADLAAQGKATPSSDVAGAFAFNIIEGTRAKLDLGETTYLVNSVPAPRRQPVPMSVDWRAQSYTGGAFLVVALFLAMIFSIPPDMKSLSLDAFMNDQRFAKFLIKPPEEKEEQIPEWLKKKSPDDAGGKGKRHKGEEGKMGKKTSKNKAGLYAIKGPKDATPQLAKQIAEEQAKNAGVLGLLKATEGSHLASIFGKDSAIGNDAENVLGGLVGTQVGEAYGVGGLGLVGSGRGGGGTGEGTIGLGNLGTIGRGGGGGSGSGYGRGAGGLGGRRAHAPDVVPGTAQVRGSLDKEIIRRIIRRHINEVKFCYEKELTKKPDLYGRVIVQFTIAGSGQVVASVVQSSTMNNPSVEQCIAGAVHRWEFPKPQGGGIVIVGYPFVLKAAGGGDE